MAGVKRIRKIQELSFRGYWDCISGDVVERLNAAPRRSGYCFWNVESTGDYVTDLTKGAELAKEFLAFARTCSVPGLQHVVGDMPRRIGGLEVGFLSYIADAAAYDRRVARAVLARNESFRDAMGDVADDEENPEILADATQTALEESNRAFRDAYFDYIEGEDY